MAGGVSGIPAGHPSLTPHLVVKGASEAIEFYKKAFGAIEHSRMPGPDGRLMHSDLQIGNSRLFVVDEFPEYGSVGPKDGSGLSLHLFVDDADEVFRQAVAAGATVEMPLSDMFWGDRYGKVVDPFGHHWSIAMRVEDLTPQEMQERGKAFFGGGS